MFNKEVDKGLINISVIALLAICLPIVVTPKWASEVINGLFGFITANFGWLFLLAGVGFLVFMLYVAMSRYGNIVLGGDKSKVEYSTFSWISMMFCAGIGSGILYWSVVEWGYYVDGPPLGIEARTTQAWEWAATYGIFHWGPIAWAFYGVSSIAIGYLMFNRKSDVVSMSQVCQPVLKGHSDGVIGKLFNIIYVLALLAAVGTSLGLGTPLIAASFSELTGVNTGFGLNLIIVIITAVVFGYSVYSGLDNGIKKLSEWATYIVIFIILYVLAVGPTVFMLKTFVNSLGLLLDSFVRVSLWSDPIKAGGFVEGWTVFYWAWWAVYGPFMGMFIARISRGRTIRFVVLGTLIFGTLGCAIFFGVLGNYALNLEFTETLKVTKLMSELGAPGAIIEVFKTLPMGSIMIAILGVACVLMLATTFDSSSYTLAMISSKQKTGEIIDPERSLRLFWSVVISILPIALMFLGGLKPLQTASIVMGLPVVIILAITAISFFKMVGQDNAVK